LLAGFDALLQSLSVVRHAAAAAGGKGRVALQLQIHSLHYPPPYPPAPHLYHQLQDFKEPGSQSKQYFLGLEAVFAGSGNPAYPGGQASLQPLFLVACAAGFAVLDLLLRALATGLPRRTDTLWALLHAS
jgi:hypothetical protein